MLNDHKKPNIYVYLKSEGNSLTLVLSNDAKEVNINARPYLFKVDKVRTIINGKSETINLREVLHG